MHVTKQTKSVTKHTGCYIISTWR